LGLALTLILLIPNLFLFADWPMTACNPQRTSWTSEEVGGDIYAGTIKAEWYRPIDAYIPPNFQVIAANDLVYVSSSRGLYAFRYNTGDLVWRYDTELPLGNSPAIATVNSISMAFVGGYDKKMHALNAITGQPLWEFSGAKAGFDANPLVINNMVYVGNRDGYFYAINAVNGALVWQYPAPDAEPLGPIHLSPAYNNNTLYFATDYNYAYALNMDGTLKWKSPSKLVGDGYNSYWPVVYTHPATNKDYVIFSGNIPYREFMRPGTLSSNNSDTYSMYGADSGSFGQTVAISDSWASGKTVLDYAGLAEFLEQKPHLRIYTVLDGENGVEYTMDLDNDGRPEYFPALPMANPNTQAPPVIANDLLFISNDRGNGRHHVMGWKFGTRYFGDSNLDAAGDEPVVLSGGGNNIYKILCCSRSSTYTTLPALTNQSVLWPYGGNSLGQFAPGYDEKLHYLEASNPLDNITAQFGGPNGIYGYHGDQNPMVPYKGKLFSIKGNSILAFGSGTALGKLPMLAGASVTQTVQTPDATGLMVRLEKEVQKVVTAGLLKPGYYNDSHFTCAHNHMDNYFENPCDALVTLSRAYPYLSASLQQQVGVYLQNQYSLYFDPVMQYRIGWKDGVQRDAIDLPPEIISDFENLPAEYRDGYEGRWSWYFGNYININPITFYAMWKYAANVAPSNTQRIYQAARDKITTPYAGGTHVSPTATDGYLIDHPYECNAYIAGYIGFLRLQELAGKQTEDIQVCTEIADELRRLVVLRANNFSKDSPYTNYGDGYEMTMMNLSRNFLFIVPELREELQKLNLLTAFVSNSREALLEYNNVGPYWFVSRFNAATAESGFQNLYDYPALFSAKAWILQDSREELYKYLDVPAFPRGDYFYIQNLIAIVEVSLSTGTTSPNAAAIQNGALNVTAVSAANGTFRFFVTLPNFGEYALNVYDIAGRSLWSCRQNNVAAGLCRTTVDWRAEIGNGMYFVRLRQGTRSVVKRFVSVE